MLYHTVWISDKTAWDWSLIQCIITVATYEQSFYQHIFLRLWKFSISWAWYLYLNLYYHCQKWLYMWPLVRGWASRTQQEWWPCWQQGHHATSSSQLHGPLSAVYIGTHLWACKTHEMREVGYGLEWRHQNIRPGLLAIRFPAYTYTYTISINQC